MSIHRIFRSLHRIGRGAPWLLALFSPALAGAASIAWIGPTAGVHQWSAPSNWPQGRVPTALDDVRIEGEGTQLVVQIVGSAVAGSLDSSCTLQVIGDLAANSQLTVGGILRNRGALELRSRRSDRSSAVTVSGAGIDNLGAIRVVAENGGGRRIDAGFANRGQFIVEPAIHLAVGSAGKTNVFAAGSLAVNGTMTVTGGRVGLAGGTIAGDLALINSEVLVAPSFDTAATLRILGTSSRLIGNGSALVTLRLDADAANNTTLATAPNALNAGRILLSSSRGDRSIRLVMTNRFTNGPSGRIEAALDGGGDRSIDGTLVNQGRLLAPDVPLVFTGTYQADGGAAEGRVEFWNARIVPTRATAAPTELSLFGANSVLDGNIPPNLRLRVISDGAANATLRLSGSMVNRGTITLENLRVDRNAAVFGQGFSIENRGTIEAIALGGGVIAGVDNHGRIHASQSARFTVEPGSEPFIQSAGQIDVAGQMLVFGGRFNLLGGAMTGDVTIVGGEIFTSPAHTNRTELTVVGTLSKLAANGSSAVLLHLRNNTGMNTDLTTLSNAVNNGRIVLGSELPNRYTRMELGAGFLNNGTIEAVVEGGGERALNGRLINRGRLLSPEASLVFTGTYEADGGVAEGKVRFQNARIVPLRSTPAPTSLDLYGAASVLERDNLANLELRVISDAGANAVLTLASNVVNNGVIRLQTISSNRTTSLASASGAVVNGSRGVIVSMPENAGGRSIRGRLVNRGTISLLHDLVANLNGAAHANFGTINVGGKTFEAVGASFLNAEGGRIEGSGTLNVASAPFTNAGVLSPGGAPGILTIQGNFVQDPSGIILTEIAGIGPAGTGHDQIRVVSGSATLNGGTIAARLLGSYVPEPDARFRVLDSSVRVTGRFANHRHFQVLPDRYLRPEYLPAALELRAFAGVDASQPPTIAVHPASKDVAEGSPVEFLVSVNGAGPFTFQWRRNGVPIAGATSSRLAIPAVRQGDFGNYDVVVSNAAGETSSDAAKLGPTAGQDTPYDYGDAPDPTYPTLAAHGGAAQRVLPGFSLGAGIDADPGTLQNATATADGADEDGVIFLDPLIPGQSATIRVLFTRPPNFGSGILSAWIDWLDNGAWDPGDIIINNVVLNARTNDFVVNVPAGAAIGSTFARFRLYEDQNPGVAGKSDEAGEVEDYQTDIVTQGGSGGTGGKDLADFGDAPNSYRTLLASNGPRHTNDPALFLGQRVDLETNGIPGATALGDDLAPAGALDDEDGVVPPASFGIGLSAPVTIFVTGAGVLDAWLDFNRDGDFADANERIISGFAVTSGTWTTNIAVPPTASAGNSYARFRLSKQGVASFDGPASAGEVEDYAVTLRAQEADWGDAPEQGTAFPTTLARNGARHTLAQGFHLGASIDAEGNGQPNANATGDNLAGASDEDGVGLLTPLVPGQAGQVRVNASQAGRLDAWIDFGRDGAWTQAGDRIFTNVALAAGDNVLAFAVPPSASVGPAFARFRLSRNGANSFDGSGGEGEVEDYRVTVEAPSDCEIGCAGTDFWLTFPGNFAPDPANPLSLRLRVTGANGTAVTVSIPGLATTINTNIAGSGVTILLPNGADLGSLNDAILNRGVHVTASAPVGVQAISQVRFTSDGFRVLSTEVLTGQYVVSAYPNRHVGVPELSGSQFAVVATQPDTVVTITPSVETGLRYGGFPYSIILTNAGDCYQLRNTNHAPADLTGTIIEASQPVAVMGGHVCANVNSSSLFFCDYVVEQLIPTERLATEFFTAPLATRSGGELVRIVASQAGTKLTIDGASLTLTNRGDVHEVLLPAAAHLVADKPVFVAQFASSSDFDGVTNADPFMVTIPGRSHFSAEHTVATGGTNFLTHHLTVVAPAAVTSLTLNGTVQSPGFTNIGSSGFRYAHLNVAQGIHTLSASQPIGVIVYGWNRYESYGWAGCLSFGDTTPPQLSCPTNSVTVIAGGIQSETPCKARLPDFRQFVTATDDCGMPQGFTIAQSPEPAALLGVGTHEVTLSTADLSGNIGRCTILVTVRDPSPGAAGVTFQCPADMTVGCTGTNGAIVRYEVAALRGCTPVAVTCDPPSGSRFPVGTTTVTCRISEPDVPVQECTFKVTVDCERKRRVRINPPVAGPSGREILVEWDDEAGAVLEVADKVDGPWFPIDGVRSRFVIKIAQERGKFYRLRVKP